jgi:hypothetical protein
MSIPTARFRIIGNHATGRRIDRKTFDLTRPCPECGYRIPPNELLRIDGERMRRPACERDVLVPTNGKSVRASRRFEAGK